MLGPKTTGMTDANVSQSWTIFFTSANPQNLRSLDAVEAKRFSVDIISIAMQR